MIAILLATYNSEKYLSEQIDSIINQTYKDWILYIRDDGSTDSTRVILKKYKTIIPNKIKLIEDDKGSLKSYMNFVELMRSVEADYYMFCDHDDVWLPNKLYLSLSRMINLERRNPSKPIVIHTDMKVVDRSLNIISESFWKYSKYLPNHTSFWELVSCNTVNGCTMLFNHRAKMACAGNEPYCLMHDVLVAQSVAAVGGIISAIKEPTVLYRQHDTNVIGAPNTTKGYFVSRLRNVITTLKMNISVWNRNRHIKKGSLVLFLLTKSKITFLRFFK